MEGLTLDNFLERTGLRFRVSREQNQQIKDGTLTREQAFQQALESGQIQERVEEAERLRNAWLDDDLTLANFEAKTGRRFRLDRERAKMVQNKVLTREEAFAQTLQERRSELQTTTEEKTEATANVQ